MVIKEKMLNVYWNLPSSIRRYSFSIFSFLMELIKPFIMLKLKKGKFLNKKISQIKNIDESIKFVRSFQYLGFSIKTGQVKSEIIELLKILKPYNPKFILEIGTAGGGTLFLFTRIADPNATIISVDLPQGAYGGGYAKWKIPIYQSFAKSNQNIKLIRADSHDSETLRLVKRIITKKKVDFLFIDGDHTYEGVKKDYEMYSSLVKKGGIIAFHDIVEHSKEGSCQVCKFWDEIKSKFQSIEIIEDKNQKWAGIGLIYY